MFHHISYSALEYSINRAYKSRLKLCGHNAEGVFWRNQSTQIARFEMLLKITNDASPNAKTTIADIGCGYGAMLNFIEQSPYSKSILYNGVDINRSMITACWNNFPEKTHLPGILFSSGIHLMVAFVKSFILFSVSSVPSQ